MNSDIATLQGWAEANGAEVYLEDSTFRATKDKKEILVTKHPFSPGYLITIDSGDDSITLKNGYVGSHGQGPVFYGDNIEIHMDREWFDNEDPISD